MSKTTDSHPLGHTTYVQTHGIDNAVRKVMAYSYRAERQAARRDGTPYRPQPPIKGWQGASARDEAPMAVRASGTGPREVLRNGVTVWDIARRVQS